MLLVLVTLALALGALPAVGAGWGTRLHPADWSRAVAASLTGALIATELAVVSIAMPVVLRAAGAHGLAGRCAGMAGRLVITSPWIGWPALVAALMLPWRIVGGFRRARHAQRALHEVALIGSSSMLFDHKVVIVESTSPFAFAVAAHGGAILVSTALIEQLADGELAAVLRHEQAHVRHRHHVLLRVAAAVEAGLGFLPWIRNGADQLRCAIERWADEDAAGVDAAVRRSTRLALAAVAIGGLSIDVAAFGGLTTVVARLEALAEPAPMRTASRSALTLVPVAALGTGALLTVAVLAAHVWLVLNMPLLCP